MLFAANVTELADDQFLTAFGWGIAALRDANAPRTRAKIARLFTKANPGQNVAPALLWSALLSCDQLLIGIS